MKRSEAGNSDQITRAYFDSLLLETRYVNADLPSTKLTLYGKVFETPIMTAALSHLHGICDEAMTQIAQGAKEAGALHWYGMGEDKELEDIIATGASVVKIIKPHADNEEVLRRIEHAVKVGAFAVGMDIDHTFSENGTYDEVLGLPMRPKTMKDLQAFAHASKIPFIVKGVLSVQDAKQCVEAGVDGIVVSHHHGIMSYSVPPLMVLPDIVKAVDGQMPVFVDCGIESGLDAYKALALGATAVSVGRELMKPLKNGSKAVTRRIQEMTGELAATMARTGFECLESIEPSVIWHRHF